MTTRTLLIASTNPGKSREIKEILKDISFELQTLNDIDFGEEVPETGKSFKENAILKAKAIGEKTGLLTLAEDSGLEVAALRGRPGVLSARYAPGSDLDRINKLLKELKGVPKEKRTARYKAVVAIYIPWNRHSGNPPAGGASRIGFWTRRVPAGNPSSQNDKGRIFTFEGESYGYITEKIIGSNGFGYDPIFFNLDIGKTNGEATLEEKNRVSHRARALKKVKVFLKKQLFIRI
jgi:XTP/dITP diphosphohydrolase